MQHLTSICRLETNYTCTVHCTVGWVNLYNKFESEKYTVCGKHILPKKWKGNCLNFFWAQLA